MLGGQVCYLPSQHLYDKSHRFSLDVKIDFPPLFHPQIPGVARKIYFRPEEKIFSPPPTDFFLSTEFIEQKNGHLFL